MKKTETEIIAILNVYNEELNILGCIDHIQKYVDKIVVFDDKSTDNTIKLIKNNPKIFIIENKNKTHWNERKNREISIRKALEISKTKNPWVLCVDADERLEIRFLKRLRKICQNFSGQNKVLTIHVRELWDNCKQYRYDGIWDLKEKGLLFQLSKKMTFDYNQEHHIPWAYKEIVSNREILDYNLYHLKMIRSEDREKRKNLYNNLDPNKEMQPIGYDYLTDEKNIEIKKIPIWRRYDYKTVDNYYKEHKYERKIIKTY